MDSWMWVLIGFTAGLVVFAILYVIFHKDASAELKKAMDEQGAQLSKSETKSAVLQDKLLASESAQEKLRTGQEAEYARMAKEWQARLDAADAGYREKLAVLEKHFTDLDTAFAAQLAAEKEKSIAAASIAAGIAAGMAEGSDAAEDEPTAESESEDAAAGQPDDEMEAGEQLEEGEIGPSTSLEEPYLADDALLAAGVGAGAVLVADEDVEEEVDDADEWRELTMAIEEEAAREEGDWVEEAFGEEIIDDAETAVPVIDDESSVWLGPDTSPDDDEDDDDEDAGIPAKAALAVGGAAAAAVILSDDEDGEEETDEEEPDGEEEAADEGAEDSTELAEETEDLSEEVSIIEDGVEPAFEVDGEDEDSDAALAAAAVAGGTTAAVLAAAGADDEDTVGGQEPHEGEMLAVGAAGLVGEAEDEPVEDAAEGPEETAAEEPEPVETPWPEDTSTWKGEYFNNKKLEGDPVLEREDAEIDFDWGMESPAPEINVDGFSVRWTRTANLPPGLYRFTVTCDDGARLFVNDRMVVSAWYDHTKMTFRREMELPGGKVDLRVEYYENAMAAMIKVSWERIG